MTFDDLCINFLLMDIHIYFNIDKTFRPYFEYSKYIYIYRCSVFKSFVFVQIYIQITITCVVGNA